MENSVCTLVGYAPMDHGLLPRKHATHVMAEFVHHKSDCQKIKLRRTRSEKVNNFVNVKTEGTKVLLNPFSRDLYLEFKWAWK